MILRSLVLCVCLYTVIAYNNGKYGAHLSSLLHKQARARNLHEKYNIWVLFNEQGDKIYLPTNVAERRERNGYPVFDYAVKPEYITQTLSKTSGHLRSTSNWFNAVSLGDVSAKEIETIASLDFVLQVDVVSTFKQELPVNSEPSKRQLNYGATKDQLQQINVIAAHQAGYTGKNITIAVLDSGFRTTHNCFKNSKILARYDFINNDTIVDNEPGQDLESQYQHGTQAFSCIAGQDPGNYYGTAFDAQFLLAKTENVRYEKIIEEDNFARAVEWAERLGAQIITASLGYSDWYNRTIDYNGLTSICTRAYSEAIKRGVVCISSVGNNGANGIAAPADAFYSIAVGSVDVNGVPSTFTSIGPTSDNRTKPEVAARGTATQVVNACTTDQYTTNSGTSFSAPLTAGGVALVLQANPTWTPYQVREAIIKTASNVASPNNVIGYGIADIMAAIRYTPGPSLVDPCKQGVFYNNACNCYAGYGGPLCNTTVSTCGIWNCRYGRCVNGACQCFKGRAGDGCLIDVSSSATVSYMQAIVIMSVLFMYLM